MQQYHRARRGFGGAVGCPRLLRTGRQSIGDCCKGVSIGGWRLVRVFLRHVSTPEILEPVVWSPSRFWPIIAMSGQYENSNSNAVHFYSWARSSEGCHVCSCSMFMLRAIKVLFSSRKNLHAHYERSIKSQQNIGTRKPIQARTKNAAALRGCLPGRW